MRRAHSFARLVCLCAGALCCPAAGFAGDGQGDKLVAIDRDKAGDDFLIQGEYLGAAHGKPFAAQVIALGDGKFTAVMEPGGLPGAGWDGTTRIEVAGSRSADKVMFSQSDIQGTISATVFSGTCDNGTPFSLKRTVRISPTAGAKPPSGALVLYNGSTADAWSNGKIETIDGERVLAFGAETKKNFTSYFLHVEFILPFKPYAREQERGNSGIYIHHTYELQVLDSFGQKPEIDGIGSLYTVVTPLVNACYPPLSWQTYDIDWQGPKFDASGKKTANAMVTAKLNGIMVQDHTEVKSGTGANKNKPETPKGGPLWLQDHNNPVYFRNIWLLEKP